MCSRPLASSSIRPAPVKYAPSFVTTFAVPDVAVEVIERFVSPVEVALVGHFREQPFSTADAATVLEASTGDAWGEERVREVLDSAYRRGVLRIVEGSQDLFRAGTFAECLEFMVVGRPDEYDSLDVGLRASLDEWCFATYLDSLGPDKRPTSDRVATLDEVLVSIDAEEREIWLNTCDCAVLAGRCDRPRQTCITYRSGINTTSHRGLSRRLTKSEAKDVVRAANAAGLMQTVNDHGICNCCTDCCYLFRAQAARASTSVWPASESVASIDASLCIECGLCVERCPFGIFELKDEGLAATLELCRGCGLCAETCPTEAIAMRPREDDQ